MLARRCLFICVLLALCLFYFFVGADEAACESSRDTWSTSTITHIEYNPLGLIKIEIPRVSSPREILEAARASEEKEGTDVIDFDLLFPLFQLDAITGEECVFVQMEVLLPYT